MHVQACSDVWGGWALMKGIGSVSSSVLLSNRQCVCLTDETEKLKLNLNHFNQKAGPKVTWPIISGNGDSPMESSPFTQQTRTKRESSWQTKARKATLSAPSFPAGIVLAAHVSQVLAGWLWDVFDHFICFNDSLWRRTLKRWLDLHTLKRMNRNFNHYTSCFLLHPLDNCL